MALGAKDLLVFHTKINNCLLPKCFVIQKIFYEKDLNVSLGVQY